jgi:hypothetical protein
MTASLRAHGEATPDPHGFVVQVSPGAALQAVAGVMGPSRDSAGRVYPLIVAASLEFEAAVGARPEVAPLLLDSYWQATIELLASLESAPLAPGDRRLEAATEPPFESAAAALDLYGRWIEETSAAEMCSLLDRSLDWLVSIAGRMATLAAVQPAPPGACAVRVPLGQAGGSALCFWLDVVRRSTRSQSRVPTFFWSHDGDSGQAIVCLHPPGESVLAALWSHGAGDEVWDAAEDPGAGSTASMRAMCDSGAPLSALLHRIESRSHAGG